MRPSVIAILFYSASALSAPVPLNPPAPVSEADALFYSHSVYQTMQKVKRSYPTNVEPKVMGREAARALYAAAGVSFPGEEEWEKVKTLADAKELLYEHRLKLRLKTAILPHEDVLASVRGILKALDSRCTIEQVMMTKVPWEFAFGGFGLDFPDKEPVITRVVAGMPAQRAGLRPGDVIVSISGAALKGMGAEEVMTQIDKGRNGKLEMEYRRDGKARATTLIHTEFDAPEKVFGVTRFDDNKWYFWASKEDRIAHVRVPMIEQGSAVALYSVIRELGAGGLRGLVLDLRWNRAGFFDEAAAMASVFLGDAIVGYRHRIERGEYVAEAMEGDPDFKLERYPVVVLLNEETSGGAELLAAALQDHKRAVIIGKRTAGEMAERGAFFHVAFPRSNWQVRMTSTVFSRPSGKGKPPDRSIPDRVLPDEDHYFPITPDLSRAIERDWALQTLRPGGAVFVLPMDDPDKDPARQYAVKVLQKMTAKKK